MAHAQTRFLPRGEVHPPILGLARRGRLSFQRAGCHACLTWAHDFAMHTFGTQMFA
jgi:hypothetical protein